jgi:ornithine carbamoyltransferase
VRPDVVTMAKALGNGVPSARAGPAPRWRRAWSNRRPRHTYGGNPLAAAAARTVLEIMEATTSPALAAGGRLTATLSAMPRVTGVRGHGRHAGRRARRRDAKDVAAAASAAGLVVNAITPTALRLTPPSSPTTRSTPRSTRPCPSCTTSSRSSHDEPHRHCLEIDDLTPDELATVLDLAEHPDPPQLLAGAGARCCSRSPRPAPATRWRWPWSAWAAIPVTIRPTRSASTCARATEDVARTLACYHAAIGARVFDHTKLERMAAVVDVPVVNLLVRRGTSLQALADLLTIRAEFGTPRPAAPSPTSATPTTSPARSASGVAWPGCASPWRAPPATDSATTTSTASPPPAPNRSSSTDPRAASGRRRRRRLHRRLDLDGPGGRGRRTPAAFAGFTIDDAMLDAAADDAIFLHCLPAHRGEEVHREVLDGPRSRIWPQAANRMHAARGLLAFVLGAR